MAEPAAAAHFAFVCAMPMELRPLVRRLALRRTRVGDLALRSGRLGARPVVAVVTGIGTACARLVTRRLLDAVAVERVVVVGITGAVDEATPFGALVHPELVVDGATGVEHRPARLGDASPRGKLWTTDVLHGDPGFLAELRARGVVSLDMETAAVAEVCEERHVPWSVVRAISDRATDGSVDEEVFALSNADGTPNARAVLRYAARHPGRLPGMLRLAKGARLATRVAADAAIAACARDGEAG
jgi:adenosylhomocysteine nucleosidase